MMRRHVKPSHIVIAMICAVGSVVLSAVPIRTPADSIQTPVGLFALSDDQGGGHPLPQSVYDSDALTGVSLRMFWSDVEPSEGSYRWELFDREVARAQQTNKKVFLRVVAGAHTPQWVYDAGAQRFDFTRRGNFVRTEPQTMPVPWDSVYQAKLLDFVRVFGARYANNPLVQLVYMTGPVSTTNETFLPKTPSDREHWRQVGYTPQQYVNAWKPIIDAYAQAFPNQCLGIDLHVPLAPNDGAAQGVLLYGEQRLGKRFCVQHDGLSAKDSDKNWVVNQWVTSAASSATIGFQFLCPVTPAGAFNANGARFGGSLDHALQTALDAGAHYVEIYPLDVKDPHLVSVFKAYSQRLR